MEIFKQALLLFILLSALTGLFYPFCVTTVGQALFPHQANGSLILDKKPGKIIGSELLGQEFRNEKYFWGRPSATSGRPYNAGASCGSNLGPTNKDLLTAVKERAAELSKNKNSDRSPIPVDLLTSSGSGLDPHISLAAAQFQQPRVAQARGMETSQLSEIIKTHTENRQFGLLGEPRVNVLKLNLALDEKLP